MNLTMRRSTLNAIAALIVPTDDLCGACFVADPEQPEGGGIHFASTMTSAGVLVELIGIEPTTPCLQSRCSPN
jgi:hypothetical protein